MAESLRPDLPAWELAAPDEPDESERTLREVFLERAISLGSMERALRGLTALPLVAIVAAAVLVGLRESGLPATPLGSEEGFLSAMPTPTFWLTVVLLALAWAYVLGGLLHAHRVVRLVGLGAFTFAAYELWSIPLPHETWRMAPSYVLLAATWTVGLAALYEPAEERGDVRRLRLAVLPLLFALVLALYLAFWWRLRPLGDPRFYTLALYHQLEVCSFALIPVLLVAGVDFAEWGDAAASRATALARRLRWETTLPVGAALAAAGILAYRLSVGDRVSLGRGAGMAAVFALVVGGVALAVRRAPGRVPYAAIFAASLVLMGILLGISYSVTGSTAAEVAAASRLTYRHPAAPRFQLEYPVAWQTTELPQQNGVAVVVFKAPGNAAQLYAVHVPPAVLGVVPDPLAAIFKGTVESTRRDGDWRQVRLRLGQENEGVAWERTLDGGMWLLVGAAGPRTMPVVEPAFEEAKASWTTEVRAGEGEQTPAREPRIAPADRAVEGAGLAWLGLAAAAAGLLFARRRGSSPGWLTASLLFAAVAGLYYVLVNLPDLAYTLLGASSRDAWPQLTLHGLEAVVAGATLVALLLPAGRRAAAPLLGLNLGLFAIDWLDRAIAGGIQAGRMSLVQAVLVLVALVWDIAMSGEAITNRHNRHFPRHTRVLVYLGYVLAVAAAVLFFSSIHTAQGSVEPLFESEGFAETGMLFLGTSLLVTLFVLRVSRFRRAAG